MKTRSYRSREEIISAIIAAVSELATAIINSSVLPTVTAMQKKYNIHDYVIPLGYVEKVARSNMDKEVIREVAIKIHQRKLNRKRTSLERNREKAPNKAMATTDTTVNIKDMPDAELVSVLRKRGYNVTATKTVEITL